MANPEPEIRPELVKKVRPDAIVATGRSDYPNQVNNVLGFPYIFRGALDVRATSITEGMKRAAAYAISELARETVPDEVSEAYQGQTFHFGKDYIIPKPFDQRVLLKVAPAVAQAAAKDGVAVRPIKNLKAYKEELEAFISAKQEFIRPLINNIRTKNRKNKKKPRIIFPEAKSKKVLKACEIIMEEGFATPVLMGDPKEIALAAEKNDLKRILDLEVIDPRDNRHKKKLTQALYTERSRRGLLESEAVNLIEDVYYQSAMLLNQGFVDGLISGASQSFSTAVKPILELIGPKENKVIAGLNIFIKDGRYLFLSDTTMKIDPTAEELSQISIEAAEVAASYKQKPRIAFISYTNFKGGKGSPRKMRQAAELVRMQMPYVEIDGEMQADTAVNHDIMTRLFSFSNLKKSANILIFPNLDAANISYKLLQQLTDGEMIGPLLVGTKQPVNIVQRTGGVRDIVNASALVALEVQNQKAKSTYAEG